MLAAGLALTWSTPAFACGFWFNQTFISIPATTTVGLGLNYWPGDYTIMVLAGDASIKLGDKFVIRPGVGMCRYDAGGSTESVVMYGAGAAMNVWNDEAGKLSLNIQAGLEMDSYDGGNERNIPIGAALRIKGSETMSWFAGAALNLYNDSFAGQSYSSSDPSIYGGAILAMGKTMVTAGAGMYMGDESDLFINIGASMALGSGSSALRKIGTLFRK